MDEGARATETALTISGVLADPAASFALKSVIRQWMERDRVDAAIDAEVLSMLFGAKTDPWLGGLS